MKYILPKIMAKLTGHDRYLPEIQWSKESWTHNVFRLYEKIFWRRFGIKAEMSANSTRTENGEWVVTYQAHSFEALCALFEQGVRNFFKKEFRIPIKVWIPQFSVADGLPKPASPYLLAIAFDASAAATAATGSSPNTWTHTCTGSNGVIVACLTGPPDSGSYTGNGCTYNSTNLSDQGHTAVDNSTGDWYVSLWGLINPTTGSHTVSFTGSNNLSGSSASYTGVKQTGFPDSNSGGVNSGGSSVTTKTISTSVVASNCWLIMGWRNMAQVWSAGASTHLRQNGYSTYNQIYDSNATVGTGSQGLTATGSSDKVGGITISIAPASTTFIISVSGVAQASISSVAGVAAANIKSVAGVQNQ